MKPLRLFLPAGLLFASLLPAPAHAYLNPYVRVGFGGHQARMNDMNNAIGAEVALAQNGGVPVETQFVGPGFGPQVSAGLWLFPGLRAGLTYGEQTSNVRNEYRESGFLYADNFQLGLREIGLEAAVRVPRLAGLTFAGQVAQGRATFEREYALENVHGNYYETTTGDHSARTYGVTVGFDQTNERGVAGFLLVGYHRRVLGAVPSTFVMDDNGAVSQSPVDSPALDFSGWSVRAGFGFDLNW